MGRTWKRSPQGLGGFSVGSFPQKTRRITACRKAKWKTEDLEYRENCLDHEQRTYNSTQLARKLKQERAVDLSSDRSLKNLQKKDIVGRLKHSGINSKPMKLIEEDR